MNWFRRFLPRRYRRGPFRADLLKKGEPISLGRISGIQFDHEKGGAWVDTIEETGNKFHWWLNMREYQQVRVCGPSGMFVCEFGG